MALVVAGLVGGNIAAAAGGQASTLPGSNAVTRWIERSLDAVRTGSPAAHTGTPGAARTYAMTAAAMYDAVNGIDVADGASTRTAALVGSYADAPAGASREAAVSTAAHRVLASLFSTNEPVRQRLDAALQDELAAVSADPGSGAGQAWGAAVGDAVIAARAADGSQNSDQLRGGSGPGVFPRTFTGTQFRNMTPFGVMTVDRYRSAGPPPLASAEYAAAYNEVKVLGSSTDTDPERHAIARHWFAEAGTVRETGLWLKAALGVVAGRGTVASLSDTSRLFALLTMGVADGVVVSWADKHAWQYWRPGDAIRQASTDGNPATEEDPTWSPRNGPCAAGVTSCPVFGGTPEHTSGTSTFAGAAAEILASFYCSDHVSFSFAGEQAGSPARTYTSFAQAAREAGRSRIYGGIHFQFSNDAGREAGKEIGREITRTRLTRADGVGTAC